jgi:hypothetical protein
MIIGFSSLFRSDDQEADDSSNTGAAQRGDGNAEVSDDGVRFERESFSRDEDGRETADRTSVEIGESELGSSIDAGGDADHANDLSASTDDDASEGEVLRAEGDSDTDADQSLDANGDARNEGIAIESESYSRDQDGETSSDRTSAHTGETDLSMDLDVDNSADSFTGLSSSWDDSDTFY